MTCIIACGLAIRTLKAGTFGTAVYLNYINSSQISGPYIYRLLALTELIYDCYVAQNKQRCFFFVII